MIEQITSIKMPRVPASRQHNFKPSVLQYTGIPRLLSNSRLCSSLSVTICDHGAPYFAVYLCRCVSRAESVGRSQHDAELRNSSRHGPHESPGIGFQAHTDSPIYLWDAHDCL